MGSSAASSTGEVVGRCGDEHEATGDVAITRHFRKAEGVMKPSRPRTGWRIKDKVNRGKGEERRFRQSGSGTNGEVTTDERKKQKEARWVKSLVSSMFLSSSGLLL